jgi:hypothetical protein
LEQDPAVPRAQALAESGRAVARGRRRAAAAAAPAPAGGGQPGGSALLGALRRLEAGAAGGESGKSEERQSAGALRGIVGDFLEREARRRWRDARARAARAKGRRFATICGRFQGHGRVPDLRLSGKWLAAAGFDLGQQYEVEVEAGRLTIRAV